MIQDKISLVFAGWLILSAFIPEAQTPFNMIISGIIITACGIWCFRKIKSWQSISNSVFGLWLLLSSIILNFTNPFNFFLTGIIIGIFAFWNSASHPLIAPDESL